MLEDFLINMGVSALLVALKSPTKQKKMRKIFLKVFNAIKAAFPGDPEFS
jgi:hypothetical protein